MLHPPLKCEYCDIIFILFCTNFFNAAINLLPVFKSVVVPADLTLIE